MSAAPGSFFRVHQFVTPQRVIAPGSFRKNIFFSTNDMPNVLDLGHPMHPGCFFGTSAPGAPGNMIPVPGRSSPKPPYFPDWEKRTNLSDWMNFSYNLLLIHWFYFNIRHKIIMVLCLWGIHALIFFKILIFEK